MTWRPLLLAVPMTLAAGLLLTAPASALDNAVEEDMAELAQALPPPPPPGPGAMRQRPAFNPQSFCLDQVARRAGNRTYLRVRLELKPEQMTAWDAFAKASDEADTKATARCKGLPTEMKEKPTYVERLSMQEAAMKARVERIEAVKPALAALYETLTPEQKAVLDQPRRMGGMMHHRPGPG
ncbi:MAG: Spy/CpxP family protein refolding chaperone [Pseudomonadota bacterium]